MHNSARLSPRTRGSHAKKHKEHRRARDQRAEQKHRLHAQPIRDRAGIQQRNHAVKAGEHRIGQAVANIARAFGMRVLACSAHGGEGQVSLDEVLTQSDVITLHCPLTSENEKLINQNTIKRMKDGVMIINTARGPLIDEEALREALMSGKVSGAAVDVVSTEPIRAENPLLGLSNCIITPHIAWAPKESRQRLMDVAVDNLAAFLQNKPANNVAQ